MSAAADPLERPAAVVDFEVFRGPLVAALRRSVRGKGGRPPFDPVLMFKILVLQALYSLSDEATEFQVKDRLSFQRFLAIGLDGTVPDATTVWLFRERLVKAKAIDLAASGFIPFVVQMGTFRALKCTEQIRTDVAYTQLPVRILSAWSGLTMGYFGTSHHALEDIAITRALTGLTVVAPSDPLSALALPPRR